LALRRATVVGVEATSLHQGQLELRPGEGLAVAGGRPLALSAREAAVLAALMAHPGRVVSRQELYLCAWGRELRHGDRSVDVYVHRLREKLAGAHPGRWIHTHIGFGYRLDPPASPDFHNPVTSS
jgi:DNA-binding response OmpR family regulator